MCYNINLRINIKTLFPRAGVFDRPKFKNSNSNNNISSEIGKVRYSCLKNDKTLEITIRKHRKEKIISMSLEFVHTGPYTVAHHQYYQMVDLLTQLCRRTMGGLNPHAVPYVPLTSPIVTKERKTNKKNNKNTVESSKWHTCRTKKGRRYKNNNKNKKEKNIQSFGNRFSRLQEVVQDIDEVMDVLQKAVDDEKHLNINKEENTKNIYNVDTVDMNTLDAEIQKHVEHDNVEKNENNDDDENIENVENNDNVDADLDVNQDESNEESEYDSEKERLEYRLMHPDSDSERNEDSEYDSEKERLEHRCVHPDSVGEYSDSDESVASNFELWNNDRVRCILETYSE
jgi:hypothetical protein